MEGPEPAISSDIQIHHPIYMLFPGEDLIDESHMSSVLDLPVLAAPPGFDRIVRPGDTGGPVGTSSTFDFSSELPGWYPLGSLLLTYVEPLVSLPLSPITCVYPDITDLDMSPPSQMVSGMLAADANLLEELLSPPSLGLPRPMTASSALTSSCALDCPASQGQLGSPSPVPRWRLAREGPFLSEILPSDMSGFGAGCCFRHTTYRSSDYTQLSGKYGLPLHHPLFL